MVLGQQRIGRDPASHSNLPTTREEINLMKCACVTASRDPAPHSNVELSSSVRWRRYSSTPYNICAHDLRPSTPASSTQHWSGVVGGGGPAYLPHAHLFKFISSLVGGLSSTIFTRTQRQRIDLRSSTRTSSTSSTLSRRRRNIGVGGGVPAYLLPPRAHLFRSIFSAVGGFYCRGGGTS